MIWHEAERGVQASKPMDMSSGSYSLSTKGRTTSVLIRGLVSCSNVYGSSVALVSCCNLISLDETTCNLPMLAMTRALTLHFHTGQSAHPFYR
jgi:hypothetical protein